MNLLKSLLPKLPQVLIARGKLRLFLDFGSYSTRLGINNQEVISEQTSLIAHRPSKSVVAVGQAVAKTWSRQSQLGPAVEAVRPVINGTVTDVDVAASFLRSIFKKHFKLGQESLSLRRVSGWCCYPSSASQVEKKLLRQALKRTNFGNWQLVSKDQAYLALLQAAPVYRGCGGVIDFGHETTECLLWDSQNAVTSSRTILFGSSQFVDAVIDSIKQEHSVVVSRDSAQDILEQFSQIAGFDKNDEDIRLTVRGKNINSGKPDTVIVSLATCREPFTALTKEFIEQLQLFFSRVESSVLTASLDKGIVFSGGGSQLVIVRELLETYLQLQIISADKPFHDLVQGLRVYARSTGNAG